MAAEEDGVGGWMRRRGGLAAGFVWEGRDGDAPTLRQYDVTKSQCVTCSVQTTQFVGQLGCMCMH